MERKSLDMERQKQEMDNEIELEGTRNLTAELDTEVHARELETVLSDLGSDFGSIDNNVKNSDQTKVAACEKEQQALMLNFCVNGTSRSQVDASRLCPRTRLLKDRH